MALAALGCGSGHWSVESEPVSGGVSLLEAESREEITLSLETSHTGRVNAFVNLPGVVPERPEPDPDIDVPTDEPEPSEVERLVAAEIILGDAHSLVTLPGSGGSVSVNCPGERCAGDEASLTLRVLDGTKIPDDGVFVEWEARAETFGAGEVAPPEASATIEVLR